MGEEENFSFPPPPFPPAEHLSIHLNFRTLQETSALIITNALANNQCWSFEAVSPPALLEKIYDIQVESDRQNDNRTQQ